MSRVLITPPRDDKEAEAEMEKEIKKLIYKEIFKPLSDLLKTKSLLANSAKDELLEAIRKGRVQYSRGKFTGKWNSRMARVMRQMGAKYSRKTGAYHILKSALPPEVLDSVIVSHTVLAEKVDRMIGKMAAMSPEAIASKLVAEKVLKKAVVKMSKGVTASLKGITVSPQLTKDEEGDIVEEYRQNFERDIKGMSDQTLVNLRKKVEKAWQKGTRADELQGILGREFGLSEKRARFIARQELRLLSSKYKETRYRSAGSEGYYWQPVVGSPKHPVRPRHAKLGEMSKKGKMFRWDDPPVTSEPGQRERRNHPGEDYNCRCRPKIVLDV